MHLRRRREAQGLTQQALADKAQLTREYVNYLEHGKYDPSLRVLRQLAKALDTTVGGLLGEGEARAPTGRRTRRT